MFEDMKYSILTGMMSGMAKDGGLVLNYFYKASREEVRENFDKAKKMYEIHVFPAFISAYCRMEGEKLGLFQGEEVVAAIKDGRIEPYPNYNELKVFTV